MVDINKENKSWHQDHAAWVNEVEQWQQTVWLLCYIS